MPKNILQPLQGGRSSLYWCWPFRLHDDDEALAIPPEPILRAERCFHAAVGLQSAEVGFQFRLPSSKVGQLGLRLLVEPSRFTIFVVDIPHSPRRADRQDEECDQNKTAAHQPQWVIPFTQRCHAVYYTLFAKRSSLFP